MTVALLIAAGAAVTLLAAVTARWTLDVRAASPDPPAPYSLAYEAPWAREPWRSQYPAATALHVRALWAIAEPAELARAGADVERLDKLRESYRRVGPHEPLIVVVDGRGRCCIENGHHRLLIAEAAGVVVVPVMFKKVAAIRGWGRPMTDLLVQALDTSTRVA